MKTILVVDDEGVILKVIQMFLEKADYHVVTAISGPEALEKVQEEKPELIILDIMMPGMNGIQVAEKLKGDTTTQDIPILALTVLAERPKHEQIMAAGCDAYMAKPFEMDALLKKVRGLMGEEQSGL